MAQFRVLTKSFIDNKIVEEGAVIEFDGQPGDNLELIEVKEGKKGASKKADASDADLV